MKKKTLMTVAVAGVLAGVTLTGVHFLNPEKPAEKPQSAAGNADKDANANANAVATSASTSTRPAVTEGKRAGKRTTAADRLAASLSEEQRDRLLVLLNEGSPKDLAKIHGIGKTRGDAILKARPFAAVTDLTKVDGVGKITFERVIEFAAKEFSERAGLAAVNLKKVPGKR